MRNANLLIVLPFVLIACSSEGESVTATAATGLSGGDDVCHVTPDGTVLLHVGAPAVSAHLRHGDHLPFEVWPDADRDGYGDAKAAPTLVCEAGPGQTTNHDDCDDADAHVNPGAKEVCGNGVDDTCDGAIDDGCVVTCDVPAIPPGVCGCWCGHASAASCAEMGWKWDAKSSVCLGAPMTEVDCAYVQNKHRGDGSGSNVYNLGVTCAVGFDPNACDPKVDKGCYTVWPDGDGDGYGDVYASPKGVRTIGPGQATNGADCNDASATIHPGAAEVCGNAVDDDCNGAIDDGCAPPKDCTATPTIPAGVCGCYCGAMSKSNCAALGWTWDDVNAVCLGPAMTSADCDAMQAKHRGDGSGSDVYNLGVTCSVGTGK